MPSTNQPEIKTPALMSSSTPSDSSDSDEEYWIRILEIDNFWYSMGTATDDENYTRPEKPTAIIGGQRKGKRVYHNGYGRAAPCITFTGNRQAKKEFAKVKVWAVFKMRSIPMYIFDLFPNSVHLFLTVLSHTPGALIHIWMSI